MNGREEEGGEDVIMGRKGRGGGGEKGKRCSSISFMFVFQVRAEVVAGRG